MHDDSITKRKIQEIKEHIQEVIENIGGSVPTPIPLISKGNGSVKRCVYKSKYTTLKKYEQFIYMIILATMFYLVDRGYSYNQISINDLDYYVGLIAMLTWIIYVILLAIRKGLGLKLFNIILCAQLGYFFFRISFETDNFIFPLISLIAIFIITIRSFFIKPS